MSHLKLTQWVCDGTVNVIFVYGTARSGSTITEIIFSSLADLAIHEPFTGLLQNQATHSGVAKLQIDEEIYAAGCALIEKQIRQILEHKKHATVIIKEVSSFFEDGIWDQWCQIPEKFLFTIRDPHLQYFSRLSQISDMIDPHSAPHSFARVLSDAAVTESVDLSTIRPFWTGTIVSQNQQAWLSLHRHHKQLRAMIQGTQKRMAIIDATLMRKNHKYAIRQTTAQLGLPQNDEDDLGENLQLQVQNKLFDIRDPNRLSVRQARRSKQISPLLPEDAVCIADLPPDSSHHIQQIIPLYLDMLYAPEQIATPSLAQLDDVVTQGTKWKLENLHPFVAYAIACYHLYQEAGLERSASLFSQRILDGHIATPTGADATVNSICFQESFVCVDRYWHDRIGSAHTNSFRHVQDSPEIVRIGIDE